MVTQTVDLPTLHDSMYLCLFIVSEIRQGIDVVVGTPGRMGDLIRNDMLHLKDTEHVILDEVDQMLNMGFAEQVEEVIDSFYKQGMILPFQSLSQISICESFNNIC